jgi:hypothetical protein
MGVPEPSHPKRLKEGWIVDRDPTGRRAESVRLLPLTARGRPDLESI